MAEKGFAIQCSHCQTWIVWKDAHPKEVAVDSVDEFEAIMEDFRTAKRQGRADSFSHPKLLRCMRPRWSCPASFEAFIFQTEEAALQALEKVPENWAISRDFQLFKPDKKKRWGKEEEQHYYCIMFCTEPVRSQRNIELERLMDRKLLSRLTLGMSYEIQAPLTIYAANLFEPEGRTPQVYWMPIEAYSEGELLVPPRYNKFCHTCRGLVIKQLMEEFEDNNLSVNNCPIGFNKSGTCAGKEPACRQEPKDWYHCPAFIEERKKRCPCYSSDFAMIEKVKGMWREGLTSRTLDYRCRAGFREIAFPIVVHNHLVGVAMTGQVFFDRRELIDVDKFSKGWKGLQGHEYELKNAKHVLLAEEELLSKTGRARFLINKEQFEKRLRCLRPNVAKIEEMANVRYRDIRSRFENAFRQEILVHIRRYKNAANFFEGPILDVLKRMCEFWAFKVACFLWHSFKTKDVRVIALSYEDGTNISGFGFPGIKIGQIDCAHQQSHPIAWLYDPERPRDPLSTWVKRILPLLENTKKYPGLNLPEEECHFLVVVPFAEDIYAFLFAVRDAESISCSTQLRPGSLSGLCQEFILRTCTEVVHEFGDVRYIKATERAWREFSALAAHRIGNEISSVGMLLDVLAGEIMSDSDWSKKWRHKLTVMRECIKRGKLMLTQQAKLTASIKPEVKLTNLEDLIKRALLGVLPATGTLDFKSSRAGNGVWVDPDLMEQAFRELAVNALRAAGEEVKLTVELSENDKQLRIFFCDNGPGIPARDAERIFEPYVTKRSGSGLGLTTVRRIIEAQGGSICAAESDGGARFIIRIPLTGDTK